ncbi:MAG: energy-coupling factor ABC transporter ATP-binding protein [Deltaproteobacteria bacterium]|nr:energy-coupling factor ABC transporter ATP-binding protein [Deltaproteobacteria bacterium]
MPIFSLDQIYFAYDADGGGKRDIFQNLCFSLSAGDKVGLYGPNGCGKTTLFRLVTGLEKPRSGRIFFYDQPMRTEKDFCVLRRKVGLVLQQSEDQLFCPTVLDDVAFGPLNLGLGRQDAVHAAVRVLSDLGLQGFENRLVHKLSGGEKKLTALASVLAMQPEALLLDEPTGGLDEQSTACIIRILKTLPAARIIVSHDKDFLAETSSKIMTIRQGRLRED